MEAIARIPALAVLVLATSEEIGNTAETTPEIITEKATWLSSTKGEGTMKQEKKKSTLMRAVILLIAGVIALGAILLPFIGILL